MCFFVDRMKVNLLIAGVMVLSAVIAAPASANDAIVLNESIYSFGNGGEFTAETTPPNFLNAYVPATIVNGGFETFCVEASVTFNPGVAYSLTLSDTDSQGRALTEGTAFLYSKFAKGELDGFDYIDTDARRTEAGELQAAIWNLQGHQTGGPCFPSGGAGNPFYDLAVADLGLNHITAPNNGVFDVEILQLLDQAGKTCQNQLVAGVPEPGFASLGMLALGCVVARRKKSRLPKTD